MSNKKNKQQKNKNVDELKKESINDKLIKDELENILNDSKNDNETNTSHNNNDNTNNDNTNNDNNANNNDVSWNNDNDTRSEEEKNGNVETRRNRKSITNFCYDDMRKYDKENCEKFATIDLLKVVMVRSSDEFNPTLYNGIKMLLREINGENKRNFDTTNVRGFGRGRGQQFFPRGSFRGRF